MNLPAMWLRTRLALATWNPVAVCAGALCVAGVAALAWLWQAGGVRARQQAGVRRVAALPAVPVEAVAPPTVNDNLDAFYGALGERQYAEQQVKTLFGLAAKTGLVL